MKIITATVFMLTALTATPSLAAPLPPRATEVHFGDLDLTTVAGFKVLQARVAIAARSLCASDTDTAAAQRIANDRCVRTAYRHAMRRLSVVEG